MPGSPVAPSPVIPTYRPHKERHLGHSMMPSVAFAEPQQFSLGAGLQQPPPRLAGASSRPVRSDNILELVRFFQAPRAHSAASDGQGTDTMNIIRHDGPMDLFKAGQRRLRQLGQTKPDKRIRGPGTESPVPSEKSASIRSDPDKERTKQQHLLALQREGLLSSTSTDDADNCRPSRTKKDVEAIGRPWLDDSLPATQHGRSPGSSASVDSVHHLRSESLGLGDLAALVEFSVSFPEYFDSDQADPPPYQAQNPNPRHEAPPERSSSARAQSAMAEGHPETHRRQPSELDKFPSPHSDPPAPTTPEPTLNQVAAPAGPSRARANATRAVGGQRGEIRGPPCTSKDPDDDASSLAVLLRATERLGREKKAAQAASPDPGPKSKPNGIASPGGQPHSLNQGVTDTPLFVKAPQVQRQHDRAQEATNSNNSHLHPPALQFPPQDKAVQPGLCPKNPNAGPIPLKLVAECLPPRASSRTGAVAVTQPSSPQLLLGSSSSSNKNNQDRNGGNVGHVHNSQTTTTTTTSPAHLQPPRPQVLLSPFPKQARRARSLTPDVASGGKERKKKKQKLSSPLYVVNAAAPLPPPNRPLPSVPPRAADVKDRHLVEREDDGNSAKMATPTPDKLQAKGTDSPTLGGAAHKPKLRRSLVGPRPSSRYSLRSNDPSETTYAAGDEHSLKGGSPGRRSLEVLDEVRRGRADKVHALRLRDLGGKKDEQSTIADPGKPGQHHTSDLRTPSTSESSSNAEKSKRDRRYRVSAAPLFPLPSDPPPVLYDLPTDQRRRGSASSLPGSTSTINGYGGGLSRSVSVTSGSIAGSSMRQARARQPVSESARGPRHRRADSPSLPSSDDEGLRPHPRYSQARLESVIDGHHRQNTRRPEPLKSDAYAGLSHQQCDHHEPVTPHTPRSPPRSQPGLPARHSYVSHSQSIHYLEARVAMLERQNKMLQAALLAALDIGVSHDAESVRSGSASPALEATRIPTISERSMPSPIDNSQARKMSAQARYRPSGHHHSWAGPRRHASQESRASFETASSRSDASMRAVENMLSDVEVGASGES